MPVDEPRGDRPGERDRERRDEQPERRGVRRPGAEREEAGAHDRTEAERTQGEQRERNVLEGRWVIRIARDRGRMLLYDAKGREVWRYVGDLDWTSPQAARLLAEGGVAPAR
jgi:hypothetical protein